MKRKGMQLGVVLILLLLMSMTLVNVVGAKLTNLDEKFENKKYEQQYNEAIKEIKEIQEKVENGEINQQAADNRFSTLLDDPKYNQIKLKKQMVDNEYAISNQQHKINFSNENIELNSNDFSILGSDYYYYNPIMSSNKGGWGAGTSKAVTKPSEASIGAQSWVLGGHYANGYFDKTITAPETGNAIIGVDFNWIGGALNPDDCSIDLIILKQNSNGGWDQIAQDLDEVALTGYFPTSGIYHNTASTQVYLIEGSKYAISLGVHTKTTSVGASTAADFGFQNLETISRVQWENAKVSYE